MVTVKDLPKLLFHEGSAISSLDDWAARREDIKLLLQREEYGFFPPKVACDVESRLVGDKVFAGKGIHEELTFKLQNGRKSFSFPAQLIYPNKPNKKYPFYVFINFSRDIPHKYYYPEELLDREIGVLTFDYNDVSVDKNVFGEGIESLFLEGERQGTTFGKIILWAYAMQRALDYLLTREEADTGRIAAIGHSRLGKTALVAAAFDERFAMAHSNCSGCSGAAISRDKEGERIADICKKFPHWFCENYKRYIGREDDMPFDQHFLLSLIAPRPLAVLTALEDTWADSYNQYLSCLAVSEVYEKIYGVHGILSEDPKQILSRAYGEGNILYREREGTHFFSRDDWALSVEWFKTK
ncbi:MAG: hypothetical protein E7641_07035 [Ruminococcaceae bacterium]|nr:hypothetical protein [Oscillospiraceae bacterium]